MLTNVFRVCSLKGSINLTAIEQFKEKLVVYR